MRPVLWFFDEELAFEQLDLVVGPEDVCLDEPLVLAPSPAPCPDQRGLHGVYRSDIRTALSTSPPEYHRRGALFQILAHLGQQRPGAEGLGDVGIGPGRHRLDVVAA